MLNEQSIATVGLQVPSQDELINNYHLSTKGKKRIVITDELSADKSYFLFYSVLDRALNLEEWVECVTLIKQVKPDCYTRHVVALPAAPYSNNKCTWNITSKIKYNQFEIELKTKQIPFDNQFGLVVLVEDTSFTDEEISQTLSGVENYIQNTLNISIANESVGPITIPAEWTTPNLEVISHPRTYSEPQEQVEV